MKKNKLAFILRIGVFGQQLKRVGSIILLFTLGNYFAKLSVLLLKAATSCSKQLSPKCENFGQNVTQEQKLERKLRIAAFLQTGVAAVNDSFIVAT